MTLKEIGEEYARSADLIGTRCAELYRQLKETTNSDEKWHLQHKRTALLRIRTEMKNTSAYLIHYYDRNCPQKRKEQSVPPKYTAKKTVFNADFIDYTERLSMEENNSLEVEHIKNALAVCIKDELSPQQRLYMKLYYEDKLTQPQIAERYGVNKSTVCRVLQRATKEVWKHLRYATPRLLASSPPTEIPKNSNQTTCNE